MIEVRKAMVWDLDVILDMGAKLHAESAHKMFEFDRDHAGIFVMRSIMGRGCAFVAVHGDKVVGFLVGAINPWPFLKIQVATDLVVIATRAGAGSKLYSAFEDWAWRHGADEIMVGVSFGGDGMENTETLLTHKGYTRVGGTFSKQRG